jgi:hypothetical protein
VIASIVNDPFGKLFATFPGERPHAATKPYDFKKYFTAFVDSSTVP